MTRFLYTVSFLSLPLGAQARGPFLRAPQLWSFAADGANASGLKPSLLSVGATTQLKEDENNPKAGQNCWEFCEKRSGFCQWCGRGLACCKKDRDDGRPECASAVTTQPDYHECVQPAAILNRMEARKLIRGAGTPEVDRAVYRAEADPNYYKDVTEQVNQLLAQYGPDGFTGGAQLNVAFSDPAPKMFKMLRASRSSRWVDIREDAPHFSLATLFEPDHYKPDPSIFVAVFSRRPASLRRSLVRDMWMRARGYADRMTVTFVMCNTDDDLTDTIAKEQKMHGDLMLLNCTEGYGKGALTEKVLHAMAAFRSGAPERQLFMKVDDDTFVAWRRYSRFLNNHAHEHAYVGVPIDTGIPCRNSSFRWYEPYETFNETYFPKGMAGGPGYIFGRALVEEILDSGIGWSNVLWNEDRAAGVWAQKLIAKGVPVDYVGVNGIDGWWKWDWQHPMKNWVSWADYPYLVHHGLHAESIACLSQADAADDPWRLVDGCFAVEVGEKHEALTCWQMTKLT